ncbi:hypothetical protein OHB41_50140 [Streptomyces sp. NBC_01571]|uniref:hypothetical protein n=1 Tax=Streptomyces sp. NBC_01571 TaxID=2975883 RepID=UPI00224EF989|nr:hypothetical protein [Streptomyces sp. NBC_01571]MCX4581126.1 hypothetical protein [Streptomyces sp. NBC_01571]
MDTTTAPASAQHAATAPAAASPAPKQTAEEGAAAAMPRNLARLIPRAEATGWTATVETQPGFNALLLTVRTGAGRIALRCAWKASARGYRWAGATMTCNGQRAVQGIAWGVLRVLVADPETAAATARAHLAAAKEKAAQAPDLTVHRHRDASPVTSETVSASIAATPAGTTPVLLSQWTKAACPVTLYPSTFVGRNYVGADCLLVTEGDQVAPGSEPILSVLPENYLTSNAAHLEDLTAYAVSQGSTPAEGAEFARWVIASEILTLGVFDGAYEMWERSLTCTMTATSAILSFSRMDGAGLRLECGCLQPHRGRPWERFTVWDEDGCHYLSFEAIPLDRVADLISRFGYRVAGEWSYRPGDVISRVQVEPASPAEPRTAVPDPATVAAWETDGGALLAVA